LNQRQEDTYRRVSGLHPQLELLVSWPELFRSSLESFEEQPVSCFAASLAVVLASSWLGSRCLTRSKAPFEQYSVPYSPRLEAWAELVLVSSRVAFQQLMVLWVVL
jgi:hypothetical protein